LFEDPGKTVRKLLHIFEIKLVIWCYPRKRSDTKSLVALKTCNNLDPVSV